MKNNYKAWQIEHDAFFKQNSSQDRLKFLIHFAILAPSSHNSQPWKFKVEDSSICIKADFKRPLAVSDPENRHLYIALGCALENLLTASDYYGLTTDVTYFPQDKKDTAVEVKFEVSVKPTLPKQHLVFGITSRRSNRNKYTDQKPGSDFLEKIKQIPLDGIQTVLVAEQKEKNRIADILMESRLKAFSDKSFRSEMADYKRINFTRCYFGMPGFTLGINDLLSLFAPFLIRNFNVMKALRKSETAILKNHTPLFIFINAQNHNPLGWIKTGQTLQKITLEAEQNGMQTSMSAVPLNVKPLQEILKTTYRPEMFLRLGYATAIPGHSPRLNAMETIEI